MLKYLKAKRSEHSTEFNAVPASGVHIQFSYVLQTFAYTGTDIKAKTPADASVLTLKTNIYYKQTF